MKNVTELGHALIMCALLITTPDGLHAADTSGGPRCQAALVLDWGQKAGALLGNVVRTGNGEGMVIGLRIDPSKTRFDEGGVALTVFYPAPVLSFEEVLLADADFDGFKMPAEPFTFRAEILNVFAPLVGQTFEFGEHGPLTVIGVMGDRLEGDWEITLGSLLVIPPDQGPQAPVQILPPSLIRRKKPEAAPDAASPDGAAPY